VGAFYLSYTVLKGYSGIFKKKGSSLWNFVPNSDLRKFRFGISIAETCYRLRSYMQHDKLDRSISWQYLPTCDDRALVYHSYRPTLSTARFRRAGLLQQLILVHFCFDVLPKLEINDI